MKGLGRGQPAAKERDFANIWGAPRRSEPASMTGRCARDNLRHLADAATQLQNPDLEAFIDRTVQEFPALAQDGDTVKALVHKLACPTLMVRRSDDGPSSQALAYFMHAIAPGSPVNPPLPPMVEVDGRELVAAQALVDKLGSGRHNAVAWLWNITLTQKVACDILEWVGGNEQRLDCSLAQTAADVIAKNLSWENAKVLLQFTDGLRERLGALSGPTWVRILQSPWIKEETDAQDLWKLFELNTKIQPVSIEPMLKAVRSASFWRQNKKSLWAQKLYERRCTSWDAIPRSEKPFTVPKQGLYSTRFRVPISELRSVLMPLAETPLVSQNLKVDGQPWLVCIERVVLGILEGRPHQVLRLRLEPLAQLENERTAKIRVVLAGQAHTVEGSCQQQQPLTMLLSDQQLQALVELPLNMLVAEIRLT